MRLLHLAARVVMSRHFLCRQVAIVLCLVLAAASAFHAAHAQSFDPGGQAPTTLADDLSADPCQDAADHEPGGSCPGSVTCPFLVFISPMESSAPTSVPEFARAADERGQETPATLRVRPPKLPIQA